MLSLDEFPDELKLELLSFAPELRFVSREWFCLHNVLYGLRCNRIHRGAWSDIELEVVAEYIKSEFSFLDRLRELCHCYMLSVCKDNGVIKYVTDSWYWIYCALFVFQVIQVEPGMLQTPMRCLVVKNNELPSLNLWVELTEVIPELKLDITVTVVLGSFSDSDEDRRSTIIIKPKYRDVSAWVNRKGYYCIYINKLNLPASWNATTGVPLKFVTQLSGTGSRALKVHAIDFTPYQASHEWFLFYTSSAAFQRMISRRLWYRSSPTQPNGDAPPKREFVFRYPNVQLESDDLDWTRPYILK
ncbi:Ucc1p Ecym_5234 [Eremothecium cymbalariae DBVPG|uniref:Uncharacterized protein n=1 Tax=Eremothecium cymbalariae (strain CBS 270.75 / DBVPG 7215 / KCTC 17166 / NRRL Y-17582) TaxID=931890 RepID=I6ND60_ERECY|nr:hypothetical protein Ecym_5234 [Eremothecium cymbalariae DBVPG\